MCCSKARCLKGLIFTTNVMFVVVGMAMLVGKFQNLTDLHFDRKEFIFSSIKGGPVCIQSTFSIV